MSEPENDMLATLYGWTRKTSIGNQEAYNELWLEIDRKLKLLDYLETALEEIYHRAKVIE